MKMLLSHDPHDQSVYVTAVAAAEGSHLRGKLALKIRPGQNFLGHTYEDLVCLGNGMHELEPRPGWLPKGSPTDGDESPATEGPGTSVPANKQYWQSTANPEAD
jgi:hypothetical protein